jgi:DNA-binding NtrC family response regulator
MAKTKILLIDDEKNMHYSFNRLFSNDNLEFVSCYDGEEGLEKLEKESFELIITDIRMPKVNGLDFLKTAKEKNPKILIIVMTAHGTTDTAIEAMKLGAYDYILKPFDNIKLKNLVLSAVKESKSMKNSVEVSTESLNDVDTESDIIIGASDEMQNIYKSIGQVANKEVTVLITGESGTGKELVARAIYSHSLRKDKIFSVVNCAAIPENLLESELFGHEKGAFTGATSLHIGKFEKTKSGTLFLDEIGELNLSLQAKLLRVLQFGQFDRLGGNEVIKSDVRIIAATNRNLKKDVEEGKFREDLFYRLNIVNIHLPPLRDRKDDIPVLIDFFLKRFSKKYQKHVKGIGERALKKLSTYNYPGNVRELENIINRATIICASDIITEKEIMFLSEGYQVNSFPKGVEGLVSKLFDEILAVPESYKEGIFPAIEELLIKKALEATGGNQVKASSLLGISRNTLRNRMERFGIS